MSSPSSESTPTHQTHLDALIQAVYENSTYAVFFHTAVAEQLGIGATEEKTLLMLSAGPLTAGEIAQMTNLTTASVTSLIDRLEKKGFVSRVRDTNDRRRVIVAPNADKVAELARVFGSLQGMFDDLGAIYTDDQLVTIIDFLKRMSTSAREAIKHLSQKP